MPYDFIFIDGDHTQEGVIQDFQAYCPMARSGGIVALHDILPDETDGEIEVYKFWASISNGSYRVETLTSSPNQTSRGIGVVYV